MSLWKIAWRSIQQRALASWLTGLSMALGVALVVIVLVVHGIVSRTFTEAAQGYNLIIGKKGSSTQLVFNTVFHMQKPIENLPWSFYKKIKRNKSVEVAVPFCLGDRYMDFRVVGTTPDLFEKLSYGNYSDGTPKKYACQPGGRFFTTSEDDYFTTVVGSIAARKAGLKVGSKITITHGLSDGNSHTHDDPFEVVGILEPTGTPNDRAVFINIEGFFLLEDHAKDDAVDEDATQPASQGTANQPAGSTKAALQSTDSKSPPADAKKPADKKHVHDHHHGHEGHHHHDPLPEYQREVTAILVSMREFPPGNSAGADIAANLLFTKINEGQEAQAVLPIKEVRELQEGIVGNTRWFLLVLAGMVVLVAGIGVMVSIYNSMSDRRRDIAIMRSLGAGRRTVMVVILLESILLSLLGGLAGVVLAHGAIGALSGMIVNQTGVTVNMLQFDPKELIIIPGLVVLASLVGYLPALSAYRTDVAKALSAAP